MKPITRILFVCHGNICRSPMAEYIFKYLTQEAGVEDRFEVASAAVSTEEIGNDIYPPAKLKLRENHIPFGPHHAHQISIQEYNYYDAIICADKANIAWLPIRDEKTSLMMKWAGENRDVSDPWYTRDFEAAYRDIYTACKAILNSYLDKE